MSHWHGDGRGRPRNAWTPFVLHAQAIVPVAPVCEALSLTAYRYLIGRGFAPIETTMYATALPERLPGYVVFPLMENDEWVSWQGRWYKGDAALKTRYPDKWKDHRWESPHKDEGWRTTKECVWGLDRIIAGEPVYVCEGLFDAIYFERGVGLMGWWPTETQIIKILDRRPSRVTICFDRDPESSDMDPDKAARRFRKYDRELEVTIEPPPPEYEDYGEMVQAGRRHWHEAQA